MKTEDVDIAHLLDAAGEQGTPGLPMAVSLPVVSALCEALEYIHSRTDELGHPLNIVHRDLNPKNVIISYEGAVKLIDFGVAKATAQPLTEKTMHTHLGQLIGTPEYMSPEQAELTGENIDTRTDVYSLGVILYELLAAALPFDPAELREAGFEKSAILDEGLSDDAFALSFSISITCIDQINPCI